MSAQSSAERDFDMIMLTNPYKTFSDQLKTTRVNLEMILTLTGEDRQWPFKELIDEHFFAQFLC